MNEESTINFHKNYFDDGYHLIEHPATDAGLFLDDSDVEELKKKEGTQLWFYVISRLAGGRQFLEKAVGSSRSSDLKPASDKVMKIIRDLARQLDKHAGEHGGEGRAGGIGRQTT